MRDFIYPFDSTKATLKDPYGRVRATFTLQNGTNSLPELDKSGYYYQTNDGARFYIYQGLGVLEWQDCAKPYDFSKLAKSKKTLKALDKALQNRAASVALRSDIMDFLEVYEKNITKGEHYLTPPYFEQVDQALTQGSFTC